MNKLDNFDNDKVTTFRCRRCHRKIWVSESIIRGMGPICYGRSYTYRRLLKQGMTREEILKIPKEKIEEMAKEELKKYYQKKKPKKNIKLNSRKIRTKKVTLKFDTNQLSLDKFIFSAEKTGSEGAGVSHGQEWELGSLPDVGSNPTPSDLRDLECKTDSNVEKIKELREELNDIWYKLPVSKGWGKSDRALEIMDEIKKLEEK